MNQQTPVGRIASRQARDRTEPPPQRGFFMRRDRNENPPRVVLQPDVGHGLCRGGPGAVIAIPG